MRFAISGILTFLFSMNAVAADAGRFECSPSPDLPVYQLVRKNPATFSLRVALPTIGMAPLFSGDLPLEALSAMKIKGDFLTTMGTHYVVDIPASQCIRQFHSTEIFYVHCFTKEKLQINGQTVQGLSFHASGRSVTSATPTAKGLQIVTDHETVVGVEVGKPVSYGLHWLDFSRAYLTEECRVNKEFWL